MCHITAFWLLALVMLSVSGGVHGFTGGAPVDVCDSMTPDATRHGASPQADNTLANYTVTASASNYTSGGTIQVTVAGMMMQEFKGLLLQARHVTSSNRLGTFSIGSLTNIKTLACGDTPNTAVTHNSGVGKTSVTVTWTAPSSNEGNIKFRVTVVQERTIFYVGLETAELPWVAGGSGGSAVAGSLVTLFFAVLFSLRARF